MLAQAVKRRLSKEENQKGFTLIELLAVIVILGIIAVIAIPMIGGIMKNSRNDSDVASANQIYNAVRMYVLGEEAGDFSKANSATLTNLQNKGYLDNPIYLPSTKEALTEVTVNFDANGKLTDPNAGHAVILKTSKDTKTYTAEEVLKSKPNPAPAPTGK